MAKNFWPFFDPPKTGSRRCRPKSNISFESPQAALHTPLLRSSEWTPYLFTVCYLPLSRDNIWLPYIGHYIISNIDRCMLTYSDSYHMICSFSRDMDRLQTDKFKPFRSWGRFCWTWRFRSEIQCSQICLGFIYICSPFYTQCKKSEKSTRFLQKWNLKSLWKNFIKRIDNEK